MGRFGLIGYPLTHSQSVFLHDTIASLYQLDVQYELLTMTTKSDIKSLLSDLRTGLYQGFNVTIPYKETVIPLLDTLSLKAERIGAVNTIYLKDGKIHGDNTDYEGLLSLFLSSEAIFKDQHVLVLGSGGAAKTAYHVLKDLNAIPIIVSRKKKQDYSFERCLSYEDISKVSYQMIVNTTPVGTYPDVDASVLTEEQVKECVVFDLIYNPKETKLMRDAKIGYNGLHMLIVQAIKAQALWQQKELVVNDEVIERIKEVMDV